jgi:hypothetical protein
MYIKINKIGKQEVGIWWAWKRFPRYGVPMWSLWPNIRFLPSIVAEKNATKNELICSMCIKINKVGKQEVGIWRVQKRYPQYGIPIWCLWPNIRFLSSTFTEKNATKNILDGRRTEGQKDGRKDGKTDRGKTVYPPPPSGSGGILKVIGLITFIAPFDSYCETWYTNFSEYCIIFRRDSDILYIYTSIKKSLKEPNG